MRYWEITEDTQHTMGEIDIANRAWDQVLDDPRDMIPLADNLFVTIKSPPGNSNMRKIGNDLYLITIYGWKDNRSRETFIHEYTHYRDFLRGAGKELTAYARHREESRNGKSYAANDLEFNAIFSAFLHRVIRGGDFHYWSAKPYRDFSSEMISRYDDGSLRSLPTPWDRKFQKRLYGVWTWMNDHPEVRAKRELERQEWEELMTSLSSHQGKDHPFLF